MPRVSRYVYLRWERCHQFAPQQNKQCCTYKCYILSNRWVYQVTSFDLTHTGIVLKSLTSKHRTSNRKSPSKSILFFFQLHEFHCKKCGVTDHRIKENIKFGNHIYLLIDLQPQTQSCSHLDCTSLPKPEINKENDLLLEHTKQT